MVLIGIDPYPPGPGTSMIFFLIEELADHDPAIESYESWRFFLPGHCVHSLHWVSSQSEPGHGEKDAMTPCLSGCDFTPVFRRKDAAKPLDIV